MSGHERNAADIIENIRKNKKISTGTLCNRIGIDKKHYSRQMSTLGLKRLIKCCDALGVELCIIDGWMKYRINEFSAMPEVEILFNEMNAIARDDSDRYALRAEMKNERDRERKATQEKADAQTHCRGCKNCIVELEQDGAYWCKHFEDYVIKKECEGYDARDIPKIFRE